MENTIIIIGAGVAGLAAGCYAGMNGFQATIYEMGRNPGGLCTSWRGGGYLFDGSVAGLAGAARGNPLYRLWEEIGVVKYCPLHFGENFGHILSPDGRSVTVHANIDRLEEHLIGLFPEESKPIKELTGAIRSVLSVDPPFSSAGGLAGLKQRTSAGASMLAHMPAILRYSSTTIRKFSKKFHDPFLRSAFNNLVHFGGPDVPMLTLLLPLAYAHRKMAGIPVRGWLSFAQAIERRFLELGGTICYGSRVNNLLIENGSARGIILSNGDRKTADIILSTADGRFSNYALTGRQEDPAHTPFRPERVSDQPVQVNLGVAEDMSQYNGPITYLLPIPFSAAGKTHSRITVHTRYYDSAAAPPGKSSVTVFLDSDYNWWENISNDSNRYQLEKQNAARKIIDTITSFRPGFDKKVEVIDVSTPLTRERYTGNWMGAMQAFRPSSNMIRALISTKQRNTIDGLNNFYMAGQWVEPWGGITTAAQSGRKVISLICKHKKIPFFTNIP